MYFITATRVTCNRKITKRGSARGYRVINMCVILKYALSEDFCAVHREDVDEAGDVSSSAVIRALRFGPSFGSFSFA